MIGQAALVAPSKPSWKEKSEPLVLVIHDAWHRSNSLFRSIEFVCGEGYRQQISMQYLLTDLIEEEAISSRQLEDSSIAGSL